MKRVLITLLFTGLIIPALTFAGGIVTNANQSAAYIRMLARDASTSIDAVYYNPAGLTQLENGFYISYNNQSIFQKKTIENKFPLLNESKYVGDVAVPVFPDFYAVFKKNKLALAFGFQPNAGGGSAKFNTGLPSFEIPYSTLPSMISTMVGVAGYCTEYSADISFTGSSIYWGAQLNAAYELSDVFAVSAGARMIFAKNTYKGEIKNIMINPGGTMMLASTFFTNAGNATYAALTSDQEVDAKQTGTGFTPILGVNIKLGEKLNLGIKYEFETKIVLKNDTKKDLVSPQFPDGEKVRGDIPALLSIGATYKLLPQMRVSTGMHYYFDKDAIIEKAPGVKKAIDGNLYEIALGGEYDITDKILISAGYLYAKTGVGAGYQTDLSHSLTSSSVGFGGGFKVTDKLFLNLGMLYTMYTSDNKTIDYSSYVPGLTAKETYNRTNINFAIGVDYRF
jgi:long-chain fatty acid transport protein